MFVKVLLFSFLSLIGFTLHGQEPASQWRKVVYDVTNGLPSNSITSSVQDSVGFMWFCSKNGLTRFDGINFKVYNAIPTDSNSLQSCSINRVFNDSKGRLLIATNLGLSIYNRVTDDFIRIHCTDNIAILSIVEDSNGNYYVGSPGKGLFYLNHDFVFSPIDVTNSPGIDLGFKDDYIQSLFQDKDGLIWIGTQNGNIWCYVPTKKQLSLICKNAESSFVSCFFEDKEGRLIVGSRYGVRFFRKSCDLTLPQAQIKLVDVTPNNLGIRGLQHVVQIFYGIDDGLWFVHQYGFSLYNADSDELIHSTSSNNPLGIPFSDVTNQITLDRSGNLWCLTNLNGIVLFNLMHKKFLTPKSLFGCNNIRSLFEDSEGNLWVGDDGKGLYRINKHDNSVTSYIDKNGLKRGFKGKAILAVYETSDKKIYIGTYQGLYSYDKKSDLFHLINSIPNSEFGVSHFDIRDIVEDSQGDLWIATNGGGVSVFHPKTQRFSCFKRNDEFPDSGIVDNYCLKLMKDRVGNIWIGTYNGFSKYDVSTKRFYNFSNKDSNILSNNWIYDLHEDLQGNIWIATANGLNVYNQSTNSFKYYFKNDGLVGNVISALEDDRYGNIWISTTNGLNKYNIAQQQFTSYTNSDNLRVTEFNNGCSYKSKSGELYFGGIHGYIKFNPDDIQQSLSTAPVVFSRFKLFNRELNANDRTNGVLKQDLNYTKEITLRYNENVITFEYMTINFLNPENNLYAFQMVGFDDDWQFVGNKREVTYTNLNPGHYIFRVKASNEDGVWNENETTLHVNILPAYWQTIWFRLLMVAILLLGIYLFVRRRILQAKLLAKMLEIKVHERTVELQEASSLLEENQEEIITQRDHLEEAYAALLDKQNVITSQNLELDKHRNFLEKLVEERTQELESALYKAEESNRLKSSFLANISHEIRTPMNAIIGFSSLIRDESLSEEERYSLIEVIGKSSNSLLLLINDILDLSKIQANEMTLRNKEFDLIDLLKDIYHSFLESAEAKGIFLKLDVESFSDHIIVMADQGRVSQVISNLISNGIKFTSDGGIVFGIKEVGENLTLYVKDSGIGMPSHIGNYIFGQFTKIEDKKNVLYGGTGLGLAISKGLVDLWNGKIWYKSVLNKGTVFYFTMPNAFIENSESVVSTKPNITDVLNYPDLSNITILVAEDQLNNFRLLSSYLKRCYANVLWAHNGQEAVAITKSASVDLIFMDIKMPIMDGIQATEAIRATNSDIPIFAQTAYAFNDEIKTFLEAGMNGYLSKPIREVELINILNQQFPLPQIP